MRHCAIVYINEQEIGTLLKLPEGVHVKAVASAFQRLAIAVLVEGDSLPESPEGTELPEYESAMGGRYLPAYKDWGDGYREGYQAAIDAQNIFIKED